MNLIESFNIVSNAARSIQTNGIEHDKIKEAITNLAGIVQEKVDSENIIKKEEVNNTKEAKKNDK